MEGCPNQRHHEGGRGRRRGARGAWPAHRALLFDPVVNSDLPHVLRARYYGNQAADGHRGGLCADAVVEAIGDVAVSGVVR
jgi:hypothetical protein